MLAETKELLKAMESEEPWLDFPDDLENFLNLDEKTQKIVIHEINEIPPGLDPKHYFSCILRNNSIERKYLKKLAKLEIVNFQEIFNDCSESIFPDNIDNEEMQIDLEKLHNIKIISKNIETSVFEKVIDELIIGGYKFTSEHKQTIRKIKKGDKNQ